MKVSTAALLFLILAAALGPPAQASLRVHYPSKVSRGKNHTVDCCFFYSTDFDCRFMTGYVQRVNGCRLPSVVFKTNKDTEVCADVHSTTVKECMEELDAAKKKGEKVD